MVYHFGIPTLAGMARGTEFVPPMSPTERRKMATSGYEAVTGNEREKQKQFFVDEVGKVFEGILNNPATGYGLISDGQFLVIVLRIPQQG
jgi:hypothetical protein